MLRNDRSHQVNRGFIVRFLKSQQWFGSFLAFSLIGCGAGNLVSPSTLSIIGGTPRENNAAVALVMSKKSEALNLKESYCGGTLIAKNVILTAAHCVYGKRILADYPYLDKLITHDFNIYAVIGARDLSMARPEQAALVEKIVVHPEWNEDVKSGHDIALLFLNTADAERNAAWSTPARYEGSAESSIGRVFGWGDTTSDGPSIKDSLLRSADVPINALTTCRQLGEPYTQIPDSVLCTDDIVRGGVSSCKGDSGGGLFTVDKEGQSADLIGIVSWGVGCAQPNNPSIYTKVQAFLPWINETLKRDHQPLIAKTADALRTATAERCFAIRSVFAEVNSDHQEVRIDAPFGLRRDFGTIVEATQQDSILVKEDELCSFEQGFEDGSTATVRLTLQVRNDRLANLALIYWKVSVNEQDFFSQTANYYLSMVVRKNNQDDFAHVSLSSRYKEGQPPSIDGAILLKSGWYEISGEVSQHPEEWIVVQKSMKRGITATLLKHEDSLALQVTGHNIADFAQKIFLLKKLD